MELPTSTFATLSWNVFLQLQLQVPVYLSHILLFWSTVRQEFSSYREQCFLHNKSLLWALRKRRFRNSSKATKGKWTSFSDCQVKPREFPVCHVQRLDTLWCRARFHHVIKYVKPAQALYTSANPFLNFDRDATPAQSHLPLSTDYRSQSEEKENKEEHRCKTQQPPGQWCKHYAMILPHRIAVILVVVWIFFNTSSRHSLSELSLISLILLNFT